MVTEKRLSLNSGKGTAYLDTPNFKGALNCIIIDTPTKMHVVIESSLGYVIYNNPETFGTLYVPLRARPIDKDAHGWNYSSVKYFLNEKLRIAVFGAQNQEVKLIFRFE